MDETTGSVKQVELLISCTDLADLDDFSASDPIGVLFIKQFGQWKECGRTEAIIDSLNPQFTKSFLLDYEPDIQQPLMFSVYDIDSKSTELKHHDFIGSTEVNLVNLVKNEDRTTTTSKSLRIPGKSEVRGFINITSEIVKQTRSKMIFHIGGSRLDKQGMFSIAKNDVFLEISRSTNSIDFHPIHRTEVYRKSQDPRWRPFEINLQKLCNNDMEKAIRFSCYHRKGNGSCDLIGHAMTTLGQMLSNSQKNFLHLNLLKPKKSGKSQQSSGLLKFFKCQLDLQHSVLDYVRGGLQTNTIVAIDFTASNGKTSYSNSLHGAYEENQYVRGLETLLVPLSYYMTEQIIHAYGFGAKLKKNKTCVNHCFPLNYKSEETSCRGIQGVLQAYESIIPKLKFSGPTLFTPVLKNAMDYVRKGTLTQETQFYHVLLIITDGVVNDFEEVIDELIDSSDLPVSVIICGVGPADFSTMDQLFSSGLALKSHKNSLKKATRDNTYFVLLRKEKYATGVNYSLTQEVMAALSQQILCYMKNKNISPNRPLLSKKDTMKTWMSNNFDETAEFRREGTQSRLGSLFNSSTAKIIQVKSSTNFSQSTGPACPTCGSCLDEESPLFTFTGSLL